MSGSDDFSFSERNRRAKTTVNVPPPETGSGQPQPEYSAPPPPKDTNPPPPRDYTPPPPRDYVPPPPREYLPPQPEPSPKRRSDDDEEGDDFELPIDPWRFLGALRRRWPWMICAGAVFLVLGALAGYMMSSFKISITLIQRDVTAPFEAGVGGSVFKPRALETATVVSLMESLELRQRVANKAKPPVSAKALGSALSVQPKRGTELVNVFLSGKDKQQMIELINLYAKEAVLFTKEVQLEELSRTLKSYQNKEHLAGEELQKAEKEMQTFSEQYKSFNPETETLAYTKRMQDIRDKLANNDAQIEMYDQQLTNNLGVLAKISGVAVKLEKAKEELRELKTRYTDEHPSVKNKIDEVAQLELQIASPSGTGTNSSPSAFDAEIQARRDTLVKENSGLTNQFNELQSKAFATGEATGRYSIIKSKLDSLKKKIDMLSARRAETEYYHDKADGYYRILEEASWKNLEGKGRWMKLIMIALGGLAFGVFGAGLVVVTLEAADTRLKTAADVKRVTGLPLLASLGDLNKMTPEEKEKWAFRAWTALSGQLSRSANHGMVCGFISSTHGEGRTTWISLLVDAASQRGLRVLTISTRPSPTDIEEMDKAAAEAEKQFSEAVEEAMTPSPSQSEMPSAAVTITAQALAFPAHIVQKFSGPEALPSAHIALPGWVWNIERRKQFQRALAHWRSIENMVLLVELPPASVPEAVLLAENLPQLIWLVDSGKPRARETREQLETLRHAKCRLVGAVLNHEAESVWKL